MNLSYLVVHQQISDEAAAQLSELLNDLGFAFDGQYFAQIRRGVRCTDLLAGLRYSDAKLLIPGGLQ